MKKLLIFLLFAVFLFSGCKPTASTYQVKEMKASVNSNGTVHVEGTARGFENNVGIKVTDANGNICFSGSAITDAKDPSEFGKFSKDITLDFFPQTDSITVICFEDSPKDGSILDSKETTLNHGVPYRTVKVFYSNIKLNPEMLDCTKVFPVDRRLDSKFFTSGNDFVVETLKLFLKGPTQKEKDEGYAITTPQNLTINSVKVSGKNVQVDFGKELFDAGGGSCKVGAIRAEISKTVEQFFPGYQVIISANGNSEEVLQP
ncbi:MAG: hypothetical protein COS15_01420 [Caldiserica bacterium CG02_land_8_20_14_3_00_36_38]|nr:MAG: hypothetical protein COS15_01420 [Caldiserica bacterium CG02_land_8_20_14_3_00_36_38]PIX29729.1 MAG: hypothetical protein COZ65_00820 [Caldiserica bacterium CG_4_8_14_3_um_filter_35_18]